MAGFEFGVGPVSFGFSGGGVNASSDRYFQEKHILNAIRYRVEDAKAAGVHPLFALGAQVNPSAMPTGQPSGGSGVKASIRGMTRAQEASAQKDEAIARYYDSLVSRGAQGANVTQDQEGNIITQPSRAPGQLPALPRGAAQTIPLASRPKVNRPKMSAPLMVESVGRSGRRRVLNPDLGLDELSQVLYAADVLAEVFSSNYRWLKDRYRFNYPYGKLERFVRERPGREMKRRK